jgi:hypothetical protein
MDNAYEPSGTLGMYLRLIYVVCADQAFDAVKACLTPGLKR